MRIPATCWRFWCLLTHVISIRFLAARVGLACQTGPGNLVWPVHIIERFGKKHQLIDIIFFYSHRPTSNLLGVLPAQFEIKRSVNWLHEKLGASFRII